MWQFLLLRALLYIFCLSINCLVFIFAYFFCSLEWNKIFIWSIMPADIKFILKCHQEWIILHLCPYWLIPWNLTDVFQKRSSFYGQNYDLTSINSMIFFLNLSNASKGHCESMSFKDKLQDDSLQIQYWCLFKFKGRRNNLELALFVLPSINVRSFLEEQRLPEAALT